MTMCPKFLSKEPWLVHHILGSWNNIYTRAQKKLDYRGRFGCIRVTTLNPRLLLLYNCSVTLALPHSQDLKPAIENIQEELSQMSVDYCRSLVSPMLDLLRSVFRTKGWHAKYWCITSKSESSFCTVPWPTMTIDEKLVLMFHCDVAPISAEVLRWWNLLSVKRHMTPLFQVCGVVQYLFEKKHKDFLGGSGRSIDPGLT